MELILKAFQQVVVNNLSILSNAILDGETSKLNKIVLQAPTGSGKTIIMGEFLEKLFENNSQNYKPYGLSVIWASIGKGELHKQSYKKLIKIFQNFPKAVLADECFENSTNELEKGMVAVINWEALNKSDKDGKAINTLTKSGDYPSFYDRIEKSKEKGNKIVLIVDESHIGSSSESATQGIKDKIRADLVIEMSATPDEKKLPPEPTEQEIIEQIDDEKISIDFLKKVISCFWLKIDKAEVIKSQLLKKKVIINNEIQKNNPEIETEENRTLTQIILDLAIKKQEEIRALYNIEASNSKGEPINPLILIQLPNGVEGTYLKTEIIDYLGTKGKTKENGKLARWLYGEKDEALLKDIDNNSCGVEFLIFKEALATGWDCPRANILLKYRETGSETFEIQTIGRILRMPEQKHYQNEELNYAFIYTDNSVLSIDNGGDDIIGEQIYTGINKLKESTKAALKIPSFMEKIKRENMVDGKKMDEIFWKALETNFGQVKNKDAETNLAELKRRGFDLSNTTFYEILKETEITTEKMLGKNKVEEAIRRERTGVEITREFEKILRSCFKTLKDKDFESIQGHFIRSYKNWMRLLFLPDDIDNERLFDIYFLNNFANRTPNFLDLINRILEVIKNPPYTITEEENLVYVPSYALPKKYYYNFKTLDKNEVPTILNEDLNESEELDLERKTFFKTKYAYEQTIMKKYNPHEKNYLKPGYKSGIEHVFEIEFLPKYSENIEWFFKNFDAENREKAFGVLYKQENGSVKKFLPDYLIKMKDGRLLIVEVKGDAEFNADKANRDYKARGLYDYLHATLNELIKEDTLVIEEDADDLISISEKFKVFGYFVTQKDGNWVYSDEEKFDPNSKKMLNEIFDKK